MNLSRRPRTSFLLAILSLLFLSLSCTPPRPKDEYWKLLVAFMRNAETCVQYDPYTATVHYDEAAIQQQWKLTLSALRNAGCSTSPFAWYPNNYDTARGHFSRPLKFENEAWERDLWRQIQTGRGWGIVQTKYPKAGLHHGDYEVPVALKLMIQWCGMDTYGRGPYSEFVLKGTKPDQAPAAQPSAPKTPPAPQPSAEASEKLKKLKELFDSGLITKDEYELKRKTIIDQL